MTGDTVAVRRIALSVFVLAFFFAVSSGVFAKDIVGEGDLGPQAARGVGEKRVLMVLVRFPDATPSTPIETVKKRTAYGLNMYVAEQSYGLASVKADFRGYVTLPDSLSLYKISPYNFRVDKGRLRKLIEDTMTAVEKEVDFSSYDHMLIIPAVHTTPGAGYGMICYCANPGMLSGVTKRYVPRFETLRSAGGKEFKGGIFVGTENAPLGMFAHDYFHALGGTHGDKRLAPCLYDYERQSDASAGLPAFDHHAVFMGPWDIMSQHFVKRGEPPQGISSFTKIRLGWIGKHQVEIGKPGDTTIAFLSPLSKGGQRLVVKIPLNDGTYYLIENRQPVGFDKTLPDSGVLILRVDPEAAEGYGTVKVECAGGPRNFAGATYKLEAPNRDVFLDKRNRVAVIPLWMEKGDLGVLITTPDRSEAALKAGRAIQALLADRKPGALDNEKEALILEATTAFRNKDFEKSHAIATRGR